MHFSAFESIRIIKFVTIVKEGVANGEAPKRFMIENFL
jgi:hypothetical protein